MDLEWLLRSVIAIRPARLQVDLYSTQTIGGDSFSGPPSINRLLDLLTVIANGALHSRACRTGESSE